MQEHNSGIWGKDAVPERIAFLVTSSPPCPVANVNFSFNEKLVEGSTAQSIFIIRRYAERLAVVGTTHHRAHIACKYSHLAPLQIWNTAEEKGIPCYRRHTCLASYLLTPLSDWGQIWRKMIPTASSFIFNKKTPLDRMMYDVTTARYADFAYFVYNIIPPWSEIISHLF